MGKITQVQRADGAREQYHYDNAGNICEAVDGLGHGIQFIYNNQNKLEKRIDQAGCEETWNYDAEGRPCRYLDRNGNESGYAYNAFGDLTRKWITGNEKETLTFGYYKDGKLSHAIGGGMRYDYEYDALGRLSSKKASGRTLLSYRYDAYDRLISQTDFTGKCTQYQYDDMDRITEVSDEGITQATYEYTSKGNIQSIRSGRIRRPNMELQKPHVVKGDTSSIYAGETVLTNSGQNALVVEKVIRFLWDGNTILHEWEDDTNSSKKPHQKIDYQADYVVKFSEKKNQKAKERTGKGESAPESLVTWIFQDDFIPRAKITKDGCYSIMTDYLGTPVGAYDEAGNLVWERELDINGKVIPAGKDCYGRTKKEVGEKTFIPFRFQGQYEDE